MIGFGNVGKELIRLFAEPKPRFPALVPDSLTITGVVTKSHGALYNPRGLSPSAILQTYRQDAGFDRNSSDFYSGGVLELLSGGDYDILVELSALNIRSKGEPAFTYIKQALQKGRHAVTANKGPLAFHFKELRELAKKRNRLLLFESTVMDGTPVFNLIKHGLRGASVLSFSGILNSTTNFLSELTERGISIDRALESARAKGIVEADPSDDLEGWDAAAKTAILCNVLFDSEITPFQIPRSTFEEIFAKDIRRSVEQKLRWKFICEGTRVKQKIHASVKLTPVDESHPFYRINGTSSVLRIEADSLAPLTIVQENPTVTDTAYGVINDLLEITDS